MKIKECIKNINVEIIGDENIEISGIENDSRKIKEGRLFVAVDGANTKGINFLESAIKNGAKACLLDKKYKSFIQEKKKENEIYNITYLFSDRLLKDLAILSKNYYKDPSKDMYIIGITGTKGKTSTSTIISKILMKYGNTLYIGTNGCFLNDEEIYDTGRTTLESFENQRMFKIAKENNVKYIVMEVSSQAIIKDRVYGIHFDQITFTNFSKDHISEFEHPDLESYFKAKADILNLSNINIINIDDEKVKSVKEINGEKKYIEYGKEAKDISFKENEDLESFEIIIGNKENKENKKYIVKNKIPAMYNIYNVISAFANLYTMKKENILDIEIKDIIYATENYNVYGRMELQENPLDLKIYIDFAHTPESQKVALEVARKMTKGKVIVVWGADGNRDKLKRPIMAKVSEELADINIMCPGELYGKETFAEVLNDMKKGLENPESDKNKSFFDRKEAIENAIKNMEDEDILLILGKDKGNYINTNDGKKEFNERQIVLDAVMEKSGNFCKEC